MQPSSSDHPIGQQLMAAMRGDSEAADALIERGEPGVQAMLQTRNRGPYPPDRHVIDAARHLTGILMRIARTDPTPLFRLAHHSALQLEDAELSDLVRITQAVSPAHEDSAVDLASTLLEHPNPYVRYHCVRVLLQFPRERTRDLLLGRLRDSSLMVRRRVIHGMTANGFFRTPAALPYLDHLLGERNGNRRGSLLWAEMKTLQRIIQAERPGARV